MKQNKTVTKLINKWPSRAQLAREISTFTATPVSVDRVHKWAQVGAIPAAFHVYFVRAAQQRGLDLSPAELMSLHAAPPAAKRQEKGAA